MSVDTAEIQDIEIEPLDPGGAEVEVDLPAESDEDDGFDRAAWERAQQRAEQILKPSPRPLAPVELPKTTLCMVVRATTYQGLARLRGEVLDEASDRRVGLLERIGTVARLPYGVELASCGCGRRWATAEAMERHECPEDTGSAEPPAADGKPTPQRKRGTRNDQ